jgi:hypothetical protein
MNGIKYLLDTNIVLGIVKQYPEAIACLDLDDMNPRHYGYSSITRMEALGFPAITVEEETAISGLLDCLAYFSISPEVEAATILLRRQRKIKLPDAIIAATAIVHGLSLITLDKGLADTATMKQ